MSALRRVVCLLVVVVVGLLGLPTAAWFLDGPRTENWVLPLAFVVPAVVGAALGAAVPDVAAGPASRRAVVGASYGVGAALAGVVVLFVMISGTSGA